MDIKNEAEAKKVTENLNNAQYQVVDINKKEISSESPIGKGLMGHKKNDIVEIAIPEGKKIKCKILNIKKNLN